MQVQWKYLTSNKTKTYFFNSTASKIFKANKENFKHNKTRSDSARPITSSDEVCVNY